MKIYWSKWESRYSSHWNLWSVHWDLAWHQVTFWKRCSSTKNTAQPQESNSLMINKGSVFFFWHLWCLLLLQRVALGITPISSGYQYKKYQSILPKSLALCFLRFERHTVYFLHWIYSLWPDADHDRPFSLQKEGEVSEHIPERFIGWSWSSCKAKYEAFMPIWQMQKLKLPLVNGQGHRASKWLHLWLPTSFPVRVTQATLRLFTLLLGRGSQTEHGMVSLCSILM